MSTNVGLTPWKQHVVSLCVCPDLLFLFCHLLLKKRRWDLQERRKLLTSNAWVVHLYAGEPSAKDDPLKAVNLGGKVLWEVDVCNSRLWDLHRPHGVYQLRLCAASCGKIDDIIGGPPCRTYTALLHRPREGYPQPARSSAFPYGLPTLDPRRRAMVDKDTALVAKQLVVWNLAQLSRGEDVVGFFLKHPRDPVTYLKVEDDGSDVSDYPSLWRMELWTAFKTEFKMVVLTYDQGALGHKAVKPTSTGTVKLLDLDGLKTNEKKIPATMLSSADLARWAPGLRKRLAQAIMGQTVWFKARLPRLTWEPTRTCQRGGRREVTVFQPQTSPMVTSS